MVKLTTISWRTTYDSFPFKQNKQDKSIRRNNYIKLNIISDKQYIFLKILEKFLFVNKIN